MEATDSGRARPHSSSQEQEGQEPHGLCFDLEEPLTSRKQCLGAQPMGREEVGEGPPLQDVKIMLNSIERYQAHVSGCKHKNQSPKAMASHLSQIPMQRQAGH
ncbi:zinc finger protein 346-like isoform X3 [Canis lupus familiaris]|uniref:zinc finger protein 346-like isoform X3 n=1 Tax=Canis lupus familiaris TaxID=9615 RepID=UPI0006B3CD3C|nr:zinc finger protein 346-like isoform X3 [Canis lupus familiaris]XP_038418390.1 zinc finger protein 346-like isoform X2 [Canis lupus familiaris]